MKKFKGLILSVINIGEYSSFYWMGLMTLGFGFGFDWSPVFFLLSALSFMSWGWLNVYKNNKKRIK